MNTQSASKEAWVEKEQMLVGIDTTCSKARLEHVLEM